MTNSNDSAGAGVFFAYLGLLILSPVLILIGYASGQGNTRNHTQLVMSQVLAKGCIEKPQECKTYKDFYTAMENFKNE